MPRRIKLGINVDHVATLRQARRITIPDPILAAAVAEKAGADQITVHLREDRRHIQDADVYALKKSIKTLYNLEMGLAQEIQAIALKVVPHIVTLVPEKREEVTTEGGLDVVREERRIRAFVAKCRRKRIKVSLFIDPVAKQVEASARLGVDAVELHTGTYCEHFSNKARRKRELARLLEAEKLAHGLGLRVVAGHGLNYDNISEYVRHTAHLDEVNIGHSIVARAVFVGMEPAVREMKALLAKGVRG